MSKIPLILSTVRRLTPLELAVVREKISAAYRQTDVQLSIVSIAQWAVDTVEAERAAQPVPFPPAFCHAALRIPAITAL